MSFGTNKKKRTLSSRLTQAYAAMFALVLATLSAAVFLIAYSFLVNKQRDSLVTTMELTCDHIIEEVAEGESLSERGILEEQNTNTNLNLYLYDETGKLVNRVVNFHLDEDLLHAKTDAPALRFAKGGQLLLLYKQNITDGNKPASSLLMVLNMQDEREFLNLLGILLLCANAAGAAAALLVGRRTSRKLLSPIDSMIVDAENIGQKSLDARLEVPEADDELKKLALTVNGMLSRIEAAFTAQGRFVADASHELRTPLAILQGNAELLDRWGRTDEKILTDSIRSIGRQTAYMNKLVENLLFLARSDGKQQALNKESFLLSDLICELTEEQAVIDKEHVYAIDCDPALTLTADRSMVKQLLRALIDNSVKYTKAGGRIELSAEATPSGVSLSVKDTGVGMDAASLEHIFERFYRVDKARARATGGMGLGLSIAAAIVEAHGGSISAASEVEKGTVITAVFQNEKETEQGDGTGIHA